MSIKITAIPVGQMQSNCYLVADKISGKVIIIDPGDDGEYLASKIMEKQLKPVSIIATHGHFDHIMAAFYLQKTFTIPFLIHKDDEFLVKNMRDSAVHFLNIEAGPIPEINGFLKNGQMINLEDNVMKIIHTPGHTPGCVCLYDKKNGFLFSGDLIFAHGGVGRTDFSYSNPGKMVKSLKTILKLPKSTIIYPGHGESTSVNESMQQ